MTALEDRIRDLTDPTDQDAVAATLRQLEVAAEARRHRHRSTRVLATAAAVVVVLGLGVAAVRRPQPTTVDVAGGPGTTTVTDPSVGCGDGAAPADTTLPEAIQLPCMQLPANFVWLAFSFEAPSDPQVVAETMTTLRQRLDAIGVTDAEVTSNGASVLVQFAPDHPLRSGEAVTQLV